jgi:hypothetical protein
MCNLQKLENDLLRKRVLELEEMLKQSMQNNDELRNDNYQLRQRVAELEAINKELREMVCEFAHYLAYPAYVLRPETVKKITDIAAEERAGNE